MPTHAGWTDNPMQWVRHEARLGEQKLEDAIGGPARVKVVVLLASVIGIDLADTGATGSLAAQLEAAFHIGNVKLGLLIAVSRLVGAFAALPFGVLADRTNRAKTLAVVMFAWAAAEAASGLAVSYLMLLLIRVGLGLAVGAASPLVASLVGDLFPAAERGRIYGFILTGELVGAGLGLVLAGDLAAVITWRGGYIALALPSAVLGWLLWRTLPEPARGGQSHLLPGDRSIVSAKEAAAHPEEHPAPEAGAEVQPEGQEDEVLDTVRERGVEPDPSIVIEGDPTDMGTWAAVRWVLRVRTNVALIIASALGYFFLGGVESFAIIFVRGWYGIGQASASSLLLIVGIGAVAGVLVMSRLADRWIGRGRFDARIIVGAAAYLGAALVFVPALLTRSLPIAVTLITVAAFALAAANPAVDSARLDIVPSRMWGRAEGIRTTLRQTLEAFAPLVFGYLATALGGHGVRGGFGAGVNSKHVHVGHAEGQALDWSFLLMLIPVAAAGVLLVFARHRYATDVASAGESEERTREALQANTGPSGDGAA